MKSIYKIEGTHKNMRGFEHVFYGIFSAVLIFILLILPIAPVFANDYTTIESPSEQSSVSENENPVETEVESIVETEVDEIEESEPIDSVDESSEEIASDELIDTELGDGVSSEEVVLDILETIQPSDTSTPNDTTNTEESIATSTSENVDDEPVNETVEENVASTSEHEIELEVVEEVAEQRDDEVESTATSSELLATTTEPVVVNAITNDENRFSFSKDECSLTGNGAFYCVKEKQTTKILNTDRIFSAFDGKGDTEIYVEKEGELITITDNELDDDAPYFDEISNTIVWQRLVNERYQIISYDIEKGEEEQITFDRYNNMQPNRYDDVLVWQGWVGDDWEIFMLTSNDLKMLTDNTTHDVSPRINNSHIVWQSFEGGTWSMRVYDVRTGEIQTVEGTEGSSIENPRFVLVYDSKDESGDVETKGFDIKSGESLDLGVQPAPVPQEIPNPEQTGEDRALVSPVTQPKSKASDDSDDEPQDDTDIVEEGDLIIPPFGIDQELTDYATSTPLILDETTLVIEPVEDITSSSTDHIDDVVVPSYEPEEIDDSHSQEPVAPVV